MQRYVNSLDQSLGARTERNSSLTKLPLEEPHTAKHDDMGALAPLIYSTVSLLTAIILPNQSFTSASGVSGLRMGNENALTPRDLWIASHCIFGLSMLGTFYVTSATETVLLFGIAGFSWAITSRVPYSLLGDELSRRPTHGNEEDMSTSQGLIYGVHNFVICLPQILIMSLMGAVWLSTNAMAGSLSVVWFLRFSGLSALIAMCFATLLDERVEHEEDTKCMLSAVSMTDSE